MSNDQDQPVPPGGTPAGAGSEPPAGTTGPIQPFSYSFEDEEPAAPAPGKSGTQPLGGTAATGMLPPGGTGGTGSTINLRNAPPGSQRLRPGTAPLPGSGRLRQGGSSNIDLGSVEDAPLDEAEYDDQPEDDGADIEPTMRAGIPAFSNGLLISWGLSLLVHGALMAAAAALLTTPAREDDHYEVPPTRVVPIPPYEKPPEQAKAPEQDQSKIDVTIAKNQDPVATPQASATPDPTTIAPDAPADATDRSQDHVGEGRENAVGEMEMGDSGTSTAIGVGGGGNSGTFGLRTAQGRNAAIKKNQATRASENAVNRALAWFKKHQGPDGRWDPVTYLNNCTGAVKCEPGAYFSESGPRGVTIATTAYALLCYLGAGYDQKAGTYKSQVRKGLEWLLQQQNQDGSFGARNYEHAIGTMALAEAYGMSSDPSLRRPLERAVQVIAQRQNRDAKAVPPNNLLAWDYTGNTTRNDASVSGWCVMALKSARAAGIDAANVPFDGAKTWLDRHWQISNGKANGEWKLAKDIGPFDKSRFAYYWRTDDNSIQMDDGTTAYAGYHSMECVGLVCGAFFGRRAEDPMMASMANTVLAQQVPQKYPCNTYYVYYNTLALFMLGGDNWNSWNKTVRDVLTKGQRVGDGCFDGSWDPQGTAFYGFDVGRLLSTAYCTLSLEVYYRYDRTAVH